MFEVKKPEFVSKTFRFEKSLSDRLTKCAADNDISMNALVVQCCEYALDNMGYKKIEKR